MRQARLPTFAAEHQAFALRFTCEHCTYFDPRTERCTHGYPNAEHREAQAATGDLVFCKEFELM